MRKLWLIFLFALFLIPRLPEKALYWGMGTTLGSISACSRVAALILPRPECLLLSTLSGCAAKQAFKQALARNSVPIPFLSRQVPLSQVSWWRNRSELSKISAHSLEEKELLSFLEKRWLAKSNGFFPLAVDWIYPCFGISIQADPVTTSCYSRNPASKLSMRYKERLSAWKKRLPHSESFPLILTRPYDIRHFLPTQGCKIVDCTEPVAKSCAEENTIYVQRVHQEGIGGLCLLPSEDSDKKYQFLLEWIGSFGLSANRIELDRTFTPKKVVARGEEILIPSFGSLPQQDLLKRATLKLLNGLSSVKATLPPAHASVARLSLNKIREKLALPLGNMTEQIEEIHTHLSSLLEIFSPFQEQDFPPLYKNLLAFPEKLKKLTQCSLHVSGMTSFMGILKATGENPYVLYGENTYFECRDALKKLSDAHPTTDASGEDWKNVDLIFAQFNPVLNRHDTLEYGVENVHAMLEKALGPGRKKSLVLALDCTFDFINSPRVSALVHAFSKQIEQGLLNIVGYRSGLKFDLFGMDNYCGAPFFMVHSKHFHWNSFNFLLEDPALQTDLLSLNWFCLSYKYAAPELELYRKQIFDQTRTLLNALPKSLFHGKRYRVVPIAQDADPTFIDVRISGPLHKIRAATLVGGVFFMKCMDAGLPIFTRPSLGFYHPNFSIIFGKKDSTVRLTLGLDPAQIPLLASCFEELALFEK